MFHVKPEYSFLEEQILKYGDICNNNMEFLDQSLLFLQELLEYNKKVNLISRKDESNVVVNQWLHSLLAFSVVEKSGAGKILDFGSGGGFPGILLALYFKDISFVFVESVLKKTKFLEDVIWKLNLNNVKVVTGRVEKLPKSYIGSFDIVTARAVTNLTKLWDWANPLLKRKAFLLTWKKFNTPEIEELKQFSKNFERVDVLSPESVFGLERIEETRLVIVRK